MATLCNCDSGLGNTGTPQCAPLMDKAYSFIMTPTLDNDGAFNEIDCVSDTLDNAFITAKINDVDSSKRWFPLPEFENVEITKADPITESFNSGKTAFVQEGPRSYTGLLTNQTPVLLGKLKAGRCVSFGVYIVDDSGNLIGKKVGTKLRPIAVDKDTFNPVLIFPTDTTIGKIQVDFQFDRKEKDEDLRMIEASEIGVSLKDIQGLIDLDAAVSNESTTGFTLGLTYDIGTCNGVAFKGAVLGDFTLFNETTTSSVTITSVTQSADGVYDFVIPAQTSSDVLTLTFAKNGWSLDPVTVTIP